MTKATHPLPAPAADTDKNSRGRVLVAGGSETVPGALRLTGEAALRAGAGKLQLATVERVVMHLGVLVPEAAIFPLPANEAGELGETSGAELCGYLERCDTLVLGPGMGAKCPAETILRAVIGTVGRSRSVSLIVASRYVVSSCTISTIGCRAAAARHCARCGSITASRVTAPQSNSR